MRPKIGYSMIDDLVGGTFLDLGNSMLCFCGGWEIWIKF